MDVCRSVGISNKEIELKEITKEWVKYYNKERLHQSLGYKVPDDVRCPPKTGQVIIFILRGGMRKWEGTGSTHQNSRQR